MADLSVTASAVLASGNHSVDRSGNAGAAIAAGQVVYKDANGAWQLSDANGTTAQKAVGGIALNGAASGQPLAVLQWGDLTMNAVLTAGSRYYLSATAGAICPEADLATGMAVILLGLAKSTTVLAVHPQAPGVTL